MSEKSAKQTITNFWLTSEKYIMPLGKFKNSTWITGKIKSLLSYRRIFDIVLCA